MMSRQLTKKRPAAQQADSHTNGSNADGDVEAERTEKLPWWKRARKVADSNDNPKFAVRNAYDESDDEQDNVPLTARAGTIGAAWQTARQVAAGAAEESDEAHYGKRSLKDMLGSRRCADGADSKVGHGLTTQQQQNDSTAQSKTKAEAKAKSDRRIQSANSQDEVVLELSTKRRVSVRRWRSSTLIDIREFYDDNGSMKPGKKGLSLSTDQWQTLMGLTSAISEAVDIVKDNNVDETSLSHIHGWIASDARDRSIVFSLSAKRRISVRFFGKAVLIDLREFYQTEGGEHKPGKKGISLSHDQWFALCELRPEVAAAIEQVGS